MTSLNPKPCHFVTIYWNISSVDWKETCRRGLLYVQMKLMFFLAKWLLLSSGFTVKVCLYDDDGRMTGSTENRTLYTDEDLHEFLSRRGWSGLREVGSFRDFNSLEDLRPGAVYQRPPWDRGGGCLLGVPQILCSMKVRVQVESWNKFTY